MKKDEENVPILSIANLLVFLSTVVLSTFIFSYLLINPRPFASLTTPSFLSRPIPPVPTSIFINLFNNRDLLLSLSPIPIPSFHALCLCYEHLWFSNSLTIQILAYFFHFHFFYPYISFTYPRLSLSVFLSIQTKVYLFHLPVYFFVYLRLSLLISSSLPQPISYLSTIISLDLLFNFDWRLCL